MHTHINNFRKLLIALNDKNLVLCGTLALKIHGLKMHRESGDLDVAIYKPTDKQMSILRNLSMLQTREDGFQEGHDKIQDEDYPIDNIILKFQKSGYKIDIHLTKDELPKNVEFLYYEFNTNGIHHIPMTFFFKVQNIALNIEAKNSYAIRNQDGLRLYRRIKDAKDFQDLKNSNFNLD